MNELREQTTPNNQEDQILVPKSGILRPDATSVPLDISPLLTGFDISSLTTNDGAEAQLIVPRQRNQLSQAIHHILAPEAGFEPPSAELLLPTSQQIEDYSKAKDETEETISLSEALSLATSPVNFLEHALMQAAQVNSKEKLPPAYEEVITLAWMIQPDQEFRHKSLAAVQEEIKVFFESREHTRHDLESWALLPLEELLPVIEQAVTLLVARAAHPNLKPWGETGVSYILLELAQRLIKTARAIDQLESLPEMGSCTEVFVLALDTPIFEEEREMRYQIYDSLEQLEIPPSLQETILFSMQRYDDLKHPLAFQLQQRIVSDNDRTDIQSEWLTSQAELRNHLLTELGGDPQELFNHYPSLVRKARQIVSSFSPLDLPQGMIGMDPEYENAYSYGADIRDVSGWIQGVDPFGALEIRRTYSKLEWNTSYVQDLIALAHFFRDYTKTIFSFHLHFDQDRHPHKPALRGLLFSETSEAVRDNNLHTWEVRSLFPPLDEAANRLKPGLIAEAVSFYIQITKEKSDNPTDLISLPKVKVSLERLIFGYVCMFTSNPEARLAALKMLQDKYMFKFVDPAALLDAYQIPLHLYRDFLSSILPELPGEGQRGQAQILLDADRIIKSGDPAEKMALISNAGSSEAMLREIMLPLSEDPDSNIRKNFLIRNRQHVSYFPEIYLKLALSDPNPKVQTLALSIIVENFEFFVPSTDEILTALSTYRSTNDSYAVTLSQKVERFGDKLLSAVIQKVDETSVLNYFHLFQKSQLESLLLHFLEGVSDKNSTLLVPILEDIKPFQETDESTIIAIVTVLIMSGSDPESVKTIIRTYPSAWLRARALRSILNNAPDREVYRDLAEAIAVDTAEEAETRIAALYSLSLPVSSEIIQKLSKDKNSAIKNALKEWRAIRMN